MIHSSAPQASTGASLEPFLCLDAPTMCSNAQLLSNTQFLHDPQSADSTVPGAASSLPSASTHELEYSRPSKSKWDDWRFLSLEEKLSITRSNFELWHGTHWSRLANCQFELWFHRESKRTHSHTPFAADARSGSLEVWM